MFWRKWVIVAALCCVAGLVSSCSLLPGEEAVPPPIIFSEDVEYTTVEVERGDIAKVVSKSGTLMSPRQQNLSFEKRGGYLTELAVRSGARVKEGDILAAIDTEALEKQVAEQEIAVRIARINYNEALEDAGQDTAKAAVQRAKANWDLARMRLDNLNEEFEAAVIRAPMDGQITYAASLSVGGFVQPRSTVFTISDDTELVVMIFTDASDLADMTLGMEVELEYKKENYTGIVTVTPADAPKDAFYSSKPFARIEFVQPPDQMTIGHSVRVTFNKEIQEDAVLVPVNAVTKYGNYAYVRVLEDGVSRERPVELGITTSTQAQIKDGLEPGELVVVR